MKVYRVENFETDNTEAVCTTIEKAIEIASFYCEDTGNIYCIYRTILDTPAFELYEPLCATVFLTDGVLKVHETDSFC